MSIGLDDERKHSLIDVVEKISIIKYYINRSGLTFHFNQKLNCLYLYLFQFINSEPLNILSNSKCQYNPDWDDFHRMIFLMSSTIVMGSIQSSSMVETHQRLSNGGTSGSGCFSRCPLFLDVNDLLVAKPIHQYR